MRLTSSTWRALASSVSVTSTVNSWSRPWQPSMQLTFMTTREFATPGWWRTAFSMSRAIAGSGCAGSDPPCPPGAPIRDDSANAETAPMMPSTATAMVMMMDRRMSCFPRWCAGVTCARGVVVPSRPVVMACRRTARQCSISCVSRAAAGLRDRTRHFLARRVRRGVSCGPAGSGGLEAAPPR